MAQARGDISLVYSDGDAACVDCMGKRKWFNTWVRVVAVHRGLLYWEGRQSGVRIIKMLQDGDKSFLGQSPYTLAKTMYTQVYEWIQPYQENAMSGWFSIPWMRAFAANLWLALLCFSNTACIQAMNTNMETTLNAGVEKCRQDEYQAAFDLLRPLAEKGNTKAQYWMGRCHEWRRGPTFDSGQPEDGAQALHWYRMAAKQGHMQAQAALAHLLTMHYMIDVRPHPGDFEKVARSSKDLQEAFGWFLKAAGQGDVGAQSALGFAYLYSHGVERDYAESLKWYLLAAEQGHETAPDSIGYFYENGLGVAEDQQIAFSWYHKGARLGDDRAQFKVGMYYLNGQGIERDEGQALYWIRLAAERGRSEAQLELGRMYANGVGTQQDKQQAIEWLRKAAEYRYSVREELEQLEREVDQGQSTD